jgi:hypothetical protein
MRYFITLTKTSQNHPFRLDIQKFELTSEQVTKLNKILATKEKKPKAPRPPKLPYYDGNDINLTEEEINQIFTEDDQLDDADLLEDILRDSDCLRWKDRDYGQEDKPTRLWLNNRYLIEFTLGSGECIEATWSHTIWGCEAIDLKLVEVKK